MTSLTTVGLESPSTQPDTSLSAGENSSRSQVRTEVFALDAAVGSHVSEVYWNWIRLHGDDPEGLPLQHPEVALTQCQYRATAGHQPVLVASIDETGWRGGGALVPTRVNTKRLGAWPVGAELQGYRLSGGRFLCRQRTSDTSPELLRESLRFVTSRKADFIVIEDLTDDQPLFHEIQQHLPSGWTAYCHTGMQPRRRIQLPSNPEEYWAKFSSKTRQTFRRKLRKCGDTKLERITSLSQVGDFLQAAHQISLHTWQSRQLGLRVRNSPEELAVLCKLAELEMLRCYLWSVNDQPVAFAIGNQGPQCYHYEEVGYLTEHARVSPGQMMLIQMLDDLMSHHRPEWFDFGGGDADYKALFATHTGCSGTWWLMSPSLRSWSQSLQLRGGRYLRQNLRQLANRWGWETRMRQWVRYGGATTAAGGTPAATTNPEQE